MRAECWGRAVVFLRVIFALATAAYAVWNSVPPVKTLLFKFGQFHPSGTEAKFIPLMNATPVWQAALWLVANFIYLIAAYRLVTRPRGAFPVFLLAALVDVGVWGLSKMKLVYDQTFNAQELQLDYYILGGLAVMAVIYLLFSRTRAKRVTPTLLAG